MSNLARAERRARSAPWTTLILAAPLIALAACSSSRGGTVAGNTSPDSAGSGSASSAGKGPIDIGVLANINGPGLSGEQYVPAVLTAWAESVNASGGIAGHQVTFTVDNTQGLPATATAEAQQLISNPKIDAIISFDANAETSYASIINTAGISVIGGVGYSPEVWGKLSNWLPVATTFPSVLNSAYVLGKHIGGTVSAEVTCSEVSTCAAENTIAQNAAEKVGMKYAGVFLVAAASPSYTAQCLQMKSKGVNLVVLGDSVQVDLRVLADCEAQGYNPQYVLYDAEKSTIAQDDPGGAKLNFVLGSFPWWVSNPPVQQYRDTMAKYGVPESTWATSDATAAWATAQLMKSILGSDSSLPNTVTRAAVTDAYNAAPPSTVGGLLPQAVKLYATKPSSLVSCYWFATYQSGGFAGATLAKPACDPPSLKP